MIKNTSAIPISKLLEDNKAKTQFFSIPKYQREYTWGKKEWAALFNDVLENGRDYFLGSIICVCSDGISVDYPELEIIDGQQRMTTLSILFSVLYEKATIFFNEIDKDKPRRRIYEDLEQEIIFNNGTIKKPRLVPQIDNRDDYNYVLYECGLGDEIKKPKNFGNRKISKAYQFFKDQINEQIEELKKGHESFDEYSYLFDLIEKFNSAILVNIEVTSNKDAYMLFESLNNRGVPLSAIDLIKNHLIRISDREKKDRYCYNEWRAILSNLTDEYSVQERFFRHFYNAFRSDLNKPFFNLITNSKTKFYLGPLATRTTLLGIYEKLIENNFTDLLSILKRNAKIYSLIINNSEECPEILRKPLINLERIQGAPSYILLLFLLSKKDELNLNESIIQSIIELLIKFFVRRNITDFPNTRNLTTIFMDCVDIAASEKGEGVYTVIHKKLLSESSTDEIFDSKLRGKVYDENVDAVRFLLSYFEESSYTKETEQNLWKRDSKNKFVFTIEHIFPEGEKIPQCWVDMIANGDENKAKEYHGKYVHTLGNLTLTAFNPNLSNKPFNEKKNLKDKEGKFIGYKNGFKLNKDVSCEETWTVEKIQNRTSNMVAYYLKEFSLQ